MLTIWMYVEHMQRCSELSDGPGNNQVARDDNRCVLLLQDDVERFVLTSRTHHRFLLQDAEVLDVLQEGLVRVQDLQHSHLLGLDVFDTFAVWHNCRKPQTMIQNSFLAL